MYHGWCYAGDGQCTTQPGELDKQFTDRVKIKSHPTQSYKGLIFAYMGEGETPKFPVFPELNDEGIVEARVYQRATNLTNFIDNQLDEVNISFTHPESYSLLPEIPSVAISRTAFAAVSICSRPGRADRISEFLMPNILRFKSMTPYEGVNWANSVAWRVPIDDGNIRSFLVSRYVATKEGEAAFLAR